MPWEQRGDVAVWTDAEQRDVDRAVKVNLKASLKADHLGLQLTTKAHRKHHTSPVQQSGLCGEAVAGVGVMQRDIALINPGDPQPSHVGLGEVLGQPAHRACWCAATRQPQATATALRDALSDGGDEQRTRDLSERSSAVNPQLPRPQTPSQPRNKPSAAAGPMLPAW